MAWTGSIHGKSPIYRIESTCAPERENRTMFADDDNPKPKQRHEIGCDLSFLSAGELEERIRLLEEEIEEAESRKGVQNIKPERCRELFQVKIGHRKQGLRKLILGVKLRLSFTSLYYTHPGFLDLTV
jgi:uncharacterized small protein (DUF1192 family)